MKKIILALLGIAGISMLSVCLSGCWTCQSETTVLGLEIQTTSETGLPVGRFGLIRHKQQLVQDGQAATFYDSTIKPNLWTASEDNSYTSMSVKTDVDSGSTNAK